MGMFVAGTSTGIVGLRDSFLSESRAGFSALGQMGRVAKRVGLGFTGLNLVTDYYKLYRGQISPVHFTTNQMATVIGFSGPWGLAFNTGYTAIDLSLDGGYDGAAERLFNSFNLGYSNAEVSLQRWIGVP
jgi:hypothetical protein